MTSCRLAAFALVFPAFSLFISLMAIVADDVSTEVTVMLVFGKLFEFPAEDSDVLFEFVDGEDVEDDEEE